MFGKGFTEEEVKDILRNYTNDGFTIVEFEMDEKTGDTRVVIKFSDSTKAEEFAESINKDGKPEHFIRDVEFASGKGSFSSILSPLSLFHSISIFLF